MLDLLASLKQNNTGDFMFTDENGETRRDNLSTPRPIFLNVDRYDGAYSGAKVTAWLSRPPEDIKRDDVTCAEFWRHADTLESNRIFGRGDDAAAATADLRAKFREAKLRENEAKDSKLSAELSAKRLRFVR